MKTQPSMGDYVRARKLGHAPDQLSAVTAPIGGFPAFEDPAESNTLTNIAIALCAHQPAPRSTKP